MSTNKKIAFVVVLIAVIGAIWYLESLKVHSVSSGRSAQAINIGANTATSSNVTGGNVVLSSAGQAALAQLAAADKEAGDQPAVEIVGPTGFINVSSTFTLASLIGKEPVLLDFWTYSCINCVRTLPYLKEWYNKYKDKGFVLVGVHTPEFEFEKNIDNAIKNNILLRKIKFT